MCDDHDVVCSQDVLRTVSRRAVCVIVVVALLTFAVVWLVLGLRGVAAEPWSCLHSMRTNHVNSTCVLAVTASWSARVYAAARETPSGVFFLRSGVSSGNRREPNQRLLFAKLCRIVRCFSSLG